MSARENRLGSRGGVPGVHRTTVHPPGSSQPRTLNALKTGMPSNAGMTSAAVQWICVVLVLLSSAIFLVTEADGNRSAGAMAAEIVIWSGSVIVAAWWMRQRLSRVQDVPYMMPLFVAIVVLSLLWEPVQRSLLDSGRPFEMLIMFSQKNLILTLAVFSCWISCQRLALIIATFLTIFCAVMSGDRVVYGMVAAYGVVATAWLVASYWETVRGRLVNRERDGIPGVWALAVSAIPLVLLLTMTSQGNNAIQAVRGFFPGSGGDQDSDPFSRGGVNDGAALVAGKDQIRSFAPIEDAPFADSDKPSLFDVVNDQFEEPAKKIKDMDRSVALPPALMAEVDQRLAKSQQASREFSTLRRNSDTKAKPIRDLSSRALFYVSGRVPLHFRMETYDVYDGIDWYPEAEDHGMHGMALLTLGGKPWLRIPCGNRSLGLFGHSETHAIKVVNLRTNLIPSPLDLRGIHIDKMDRADLYDWHKHGMIQLNRKALPELTAIQLMSERIDRGRLDDHPRLMMSAPMDSHYLQEPQTLHMRAVHDLAVQWTEGVPFGWKQVSAICERLQSEYVLDRKAVPPEECQFPVGDFLFRTRRGPEYLFASSAAMMLRSLGYPTRLVSGFYASPDNYDARKRHTSVGVSNVHFWCEVFVGAGTWVTVEPSPGYFVLEPPPTFWQEVTLAIRSAVLFAWRHWILSLITVTAAVLLVIFRRVVLDCFFTMCWKFLPAGSPRRRILQTVRLLDRRLRYAGAPRRRGMTYQRWMKTHPAVAGVSPTFSHFAGVAGWAAYAPETARPEVEDISECCQRIQLELSLRNCRKVASVV
ncbi:MAG: transglutaminase domain-containing protein [Planctomyces sp.]|nr:transglutaminase domain-containing protein [Planctomyces sp.]